MRQADSLAPPTHPTSPEKKRLNPMLITEYVQNIPPSTNLVAIISDMVAIQMQTDHWVGPEHPSVHKHAIIITMSAPGKIKYIVHGSLKWPIFKLLPLLKFSDFGDIGDGGDGDVVGQTWRRWRRWREPRPCSRSLCNQAAVGGDTLLESFKKKTMNFSQSLKQLLSNPKMW